MQPSSNVLKQNLKILDKELQMMDNRLKRLQVQQTINKKRQKLETSKAVQLAEKKMLVEELQPLKNRRKRPTEEEIEIKRRQIYEEREREKQDSQLIKHAIYMTKRGRASIIDEQSKDIKKTIKLDREQFISQNKSRHDMIKEANNHERYEQFRMKKLLGSRVDQEIERLNKQQEIERKLQTLQHLQQREQQMVEKLRSSSNKRQEASNRYAMVQNTPRSILAQQLSRSANSSRLYEPIEKDMPSPKREKDKRMPRTNLKQQYQFEVILQVLRNRKSQFDI